MPVLRAAAAFASPVTALVGSGGIGHEVSSLEVPHIEPAGRGYQMPRRRFHTLKGRVEGGQIKREIPI